MEGLKEHWNKIYATKADNEVSWYQTNPATSLQLINKYNNTKADNIIDIGGGNSNLATELCKQGFMECSILDISSEALKRCKNKLDKCIHNYNFITSNILDLSTVNKFNIWHDRAVFHFLTNKKDIDQYINTATTNMAQNGYLILSTFSKTGPTKCSGLPVSQYNKEEIELLFSKNFAVIESFSETHKTPFGTEQDFIWVVLCKNQ